jgi:hypothetical protein
LIARNRSVAVTVAILLLLVLAVAAGRAVSALASRSSSMASPTTLATVPSPPETDAEAASSTVAPDSSASATTVPGNLVGNPGFESGFSGWRPLGGARIDRTDIAHQGSFAIKLSGGSTPDPGIAYPTVTSTKAKGALYQATVWVQASAPGVTGEVHLLEYVEGQRFAIFRSGLDLRDTRWHRLRVAQLVHVKGSTLALEVVAPQLPARADLLIDDVTVRQAK